MITWQQAYEKAQRKSGDDTADTLEQLKADINTGYHRLNAAMGRYFTRRAKTTNIVDGQQYYQLPPDCIRVTEIRAKQSTDSANSYPLRQVRSELEWNAINTTNQTGNWATYYFQRGPDEIGLWPTPSDDITAGLRISYEPRDRDLSQEDYTTGTVTVTNGQRTLTGSGTTFTQSMIGRVFKVTDGTDGYWYKISGFSSTTSLTLEEPYTGTSGSGKTYIIGEAFMFPDEYHDAPIHYALSEYFDGPRNNPDRAAYHFKKWEMALTDAKEKYASSSTSQVITEGAEGFNTWFIPPDPITGVS